MGLVGTRLQIQRKVLQWYSRKADRIVSSRVYVEMRQVFIVASG